MKLNLSAKLAGVALFITLTLSVSAPAAFAQEVERPERNESGSIAPERVKEREPKMPADPTRFIESQANKVTEKLSKIRVRAASSGAALSIPTAAANKNTSASLLGSDHTSLNAEARDLYRVEARRLAERKRVLYSSDFLKAYMLAQHPILRRNFALNLHTLLDNKLLKDKSYETTLKQLGFTPEAARAAVKNANAQLN